MFKMSLNEKISEKNLFDVKRNNSFKYFILGLRLRLKTEAEFENKLFYEINN
jgi:hypothetical protein